MFRTLFSGFAAGVVASLTAALLLASPAFAHARWASSTPGKGEAITASPARVEIQFTGDIQKVSGTYGIQVVKDRGLDVTAGPAVVDDTDRSKLSVSLKPNLSPGRYVVNWTNTSDKDGDPAAGAFSFYLNYRPNTVDLANDAQLERIGAEQATPSSDRSPEVTPATVVAAVTPTRSAANPTNAASTAPAANTPASTSNGGGGRSTTAIIAILVIVSLAGIGVGLGVWQLRRRRT